jgi:hypothetical protein
MILIFEMVDEWSQIAQERCCYLYICPSSNSSIVERHNTSRLIHPSTNTIDEKQVPQTLNNPI